MNKGLKRPSPGHPYQEASEHAFQSVVREADRFFQGEGRLRRTYDRITERLDELGISYALIGGYALILYNVRRFTEDIDLLVSKNDLDRLLQALVSRGYLRLPPGGRNLRDVETGVHIEFVVTGEFPGDGKAKPLAFPDPSTVAEVRERIKVIDLKSLIELKLASGMTAKARLQDLADVQRLIQEQQLTASFAQQLHPYVRGKFLELLP
jgi:hypothetical protein